MNLVNDEQGLRCCSLYISVWEGNVKNVGMTEEGGDQYLAACVTYIW